MKEIDDTKMDKPTRIAFIIVLIVGIVLIAVYYLR